LSRGNRVVYEIETQISSHRLRIASTSDVLPAPEGAVTMKRIPRCIFLILKTSI
jgi:hypothetical protein